MYDIIALDRIRVYTLQSFMHLHWHVSYAYNINLRALFVRQTIITTLNRQVRCAASLAIVVGRLKIVEKDH